MFVVSFEGCSSPRVLLALIGALALGCGSDAGKAARGTGQGEGPAPTDVQFAIEADATHPISPFIYGVNFYEHDDATMPHWPAGLTLSRFGGNRLTTYNWENNASNAGNDYRFQNDSYLGGGDIPGEAARMRVAGAAARGAGIIVTVPMIGHVAKDRDGTRVGTDPATLRSRLAERFVVSRPRKGAPFATQPDRSDGYVNQDEFVWWLAQSFPGRFESTTRPILVSLDNEPDLWGSTHEEIRPKVDGAHAQLTYDEYVERAVAYSRAIKDVNPAITVFAPAVATWAGATTLGRWPTPDPRYGSQFFLDVLLQRMAEAERLSGRRLMDVLDLHWYPAAGAGGQEITTDDAPQTPALVEARLQAPRSLWDPQYDEKSWVSEVQGGPIRLLPLLREKVAAHYPGTKVAITEYYYGRGGDISGGIAQADVLGIFGRESVFAATLWPNADIRAQPYGGDPQKAYAYVIGAFRMFRDYDGAGGTFGDRSLGATSSDPATASVYASSEASDATRMVIVAINKSSSVRSAGITIRGSGVFRSGAVYTMQDGTPLPVRGADLTAVATNAFVYRMPALSVSTLVLRR